MNQIPEPELKSLLSKVKLLALDVDGVMTDGSLYYTDTGTELKRFNVKDGVGIKQVKQAGIEVAIITVSTANAVQHRAEKLGIEYLYMGIEDKLTVMKNLCDRLDLSLAEVAYVGDDLVDLPVLKAVGCPFTVADAVAANQEASIYVTEKLGGQGAVRQICDLLLSYL
jgi:3-deoxy-D-manno-octulosonate 8-phosphate phosphatase (KDO 8-P phosphatase)